MLPIKPGEGGVKTVLFVNGVSLQFSGLTIEQLEYQLEIAVKEERYEDAAQIKKIMDSSAKGNSTDFIL